MAAGAEYGHGAFEPCVEVEIVGNLALIVIVSFLPGVLWAYYFYRKDRYEPEPTTLVQRAFIYGAVAVIPAGLVEYPFRRLLAAPPNLLSLLVVTVAAVGFTEEYLKYLAAQAAVWRTGELNEMVDGIIYAVAAGLGFAAFENLLYATTFGIPTTALRMVVTSIAHASFSGITGYAMGKAHFTPRRAGAIIAGGLLTAAGLHGFYDFLIIARILPTWTGLVFIAILYRYLSLSIARAEQMSPYSRKTLADSPDAEGVTTDDADAASASRASQLDAVSSAEDREAQLNRRA